MRAEQTNPEKVKKVDLQILVEEVTALTEAAEAALARVAGGLRAEVARRARLRFAPALVFRHDARRSAEGFAPEHLAGLVAGEGLGPPGRR